MSRQSEATKLLLEEKRREQDACKLLDKLTHTNVVTGVGVSSGWVSQEDGNEVTVRSQDIFNVSTWEKFIAFKGYNRVELRSLTDNTKQLADEYDDFLDKVHKQLDGKGRYKPKPTRYNQLDAEGKIWRHMNAQCAAVWHICTYKVEGWRNNDKDAFVFEKAAYYISLAMLFRLINEKMGEVIGHVRKHPEAIPEEIARFTEFFYKEVAKVNKRLLDDFVDRLELFAGYEDGDVNG